MITRILPLMMGGALGAVLRWAVSGLGHRMMGHGFPWGTLAVNLIGCLAIGMLWAAAERFPWHPSYNLFLFTGVLGAFTTFSTYGLDTLNLFRDGRYALGLVNVLVSNVAGIVLVLAGYAAVRHLLRILSGP